MTFVAPDFTADADDEGGDSGLPSFAALTCNTFFALSIRLIFSPLQIAVGFEALKEVGHFLGTLEQDFDKIGSNVTIAIIVERGREPTVANTCRATNTVDVIGNASMIW